MSRMLGDVFFIVEGTACLEMVHSAFTVCGTRQSVHILYAGCAEKFCQDWKRACDALGCSFTSLSEEPALKPPFFGHPHEIQALRVYRWLQEQSTAVVCFEGTLGFHCLQAREVLGEFSNISFIMLPESVKRQSSIPLRATRQQFCSGYCLHHADAVWEGEGTQGRLRAALEEKSSSFENILRNFNVEHVPKDEGEGTKLGMVSVCMAHYNYARFFPLALESLARQECKNFEVIVTDDGSTDVEAQRVFTAQERLRDSRFRFFRKSNTGPGDTRNFCAAHAKGEYLVFMDADNVAAPEMLRVFVQSMARTGADALTCHFETFAFDDMGIPPRSRAYLAVPMGQDLVTGALENTLGDTNMVVKRDVFLKLDGMCSTRAGVEDWEFLVRLGLAGFRQDVIPRSLFYYRMTQEGISRNNKSHDRHSCICAAYKQHGLKDVWAQDLLECVLIPYYTMMNNGSIITESVLLQQSARLGVFLENIYQRWFPAASRRQRFATACRNFFK